MLNFFDILHIYTEYFLRTLCIASDKCKPFTNYIN